ncbi:hypothetical protein [Olivibacter jilunii]|uniref:hypothetical protein n=1 Tax=Olivibacter jilunii TaxID=985016 RepID=UPI00102F7E39|nr:hypothetical protein [Olivibacter jilunii]
MIRHNEKYLDTIYKYYPKDLNPGDQEYLESAEYIAFLKLKERCASNTGLFDNLCKVIAAERNVNVTERIDFSYIAQFYLPERIGYAKLDSCNVIISGMEKVFSVYLRSDLTKVTTLEGIRSKGELDLINGIIKHINRIYPDYVPFDMNFYHTRVPGIMASGRYNDLSTYFECLMVAQLY